MSPKLRAAAWVIAGFSLAIAGIARSGDGPTIVPTMAWYAIGSLLILRGYAIFILSSPPPRSDDRGDDE